MKNFSEFYEDKEHSEPLNEDIFTVIITSVLGLPLLLATGWAASWVTKKYVNFSRKVILNIMSNIKKIRDNFKINKKGTTDKIEKTVKEIEKAPEARKAVNDIEKVQNKYYEELKDIYIAVERKDMGSAEELYDGLPVNLRENPEVKVAIINAILQSFEEPPIYIVSPGNDTYQAIKRLFGQKIARAMEELGKRSFSHYYKRIDDEEKASEEKEV